MNALRLTSALVFLLAAAAPALAGPFDAIRVPNNGIFIQEDNDACPHQRAIDILDHSQMSVVAEVPRTNLLYRFVAHWKSDLYAVTVGTADCKVKVVNYARAIKPYCDYVPGLRPSCPMDQVFAQ